MVLIIEGGEDGVAFVSIDELAKRAGLNPSHASRTVKRLMERGMVSRINAMGARGLSYEHDGDWRSILGDGRLVPKEINDGFEEWWVGWPNKVRKEDARILYAEIILSGRGSHDDLRAAEIGLLKHDRERALRFHQDPDPMKCMYPTSFLKNGTWREYIKWADFKPKPRL